MKMRHCPFCGEAKIATGTIIIHKNSNKLESVWCENCGARVTAPLGDIDYAIGRWNKRVLEVTKDDLSGLESLLKHDIFARMKEYVEEYRIFEHVAATNDILAKYILPPKKACELMKKFEPLLFAIMGEKGEENEQ